MLVLMDDDADTDEIVLMQLQENSEDEKQVLMEAKLCGGGFIFDLKANEWFIQHCRFAKEDVLQLIEVLAIPAQYTLDNGSHVPGAEAFVIFLNRLSYPNRLKDHIETFARSHSMISRIFNVVVDDIYTRFHDKLTNIKHSYVNYEELSDAVARVSPLSNCIGFIDGTVRPICRPTYYQKEVFNGHKRVHALKFQSVVFPDGIIATMHGPYEGRHHDSHLLQESKLLEQLAELPHTPSGDPFCLYGDPAYPVLAQIIPPYRGALTPAQETFNLKMSSVRESVEYGFGKILQYFSFTDFKKNMKLYLMPMGKIYIVAALMTNCHTCLYGSAINKLFNLTAPSLQRYFQA